MTGSMKAAELEAHPEFPYLTWPLEPRIKSRLPVAAKRGGPINIAYEVHGNGPRKLVLIMGLGALKSSWQRQTKDFAHTRGDQYTVLLTDNRGIGESDKPLMRYSTSEMAKDYVELLDHLGWTEQRQLHVVGVSMGGMISQELGLLIPDRICSLSLVSTAPYIKNTVGWAENLRNRINLFIPRHIDDQLVSLKYNLFSAEWLAKPDDTEYTKEPFPTNGDRIAAGEVAKRQDHESFTRTGFICQAIAAGWHHKTPAQLKELGDKVGRERIMVLHGGIDRMITFPHGEILLEGLGGKDSGVTVHFEPGQGHVFMIEMREQFRLWLEELVEKTEKLR